MKTKAALFGELIDLYLSVSRDTNGVPSFECMKIAKLAGECKFQFYAEQEQPWLKVEWTDGSYVVLGLEEDQ